MTNPPKLFGMTIESGRWVYVVVGFFVYLCLGTIYAWTVFKPHIDEHFQKNGIHGTATDTLMPYMIFLAMISLIMPIAGHFLDKWGPKWLTILGSLLMGVSWVLGSKAVNWTQMSIYYGVLGGLGVGIAYNCPIGLIGRWFPDKRGLTVGLTLSGYGLSAGVVGPFASKVLIPNLTVMPTMRYIGIVFGILISLLALIFKFPPQEWKPKGWVPHADMEKNKALNSGQMMKTLTFYGLWVCYTIGSLAGLMAIGIAGSVGKEIYGVSDKGLGLSAFIAIWGVSFFAAFNSLGRTSFGFLADKLGTKSSVLISFVAIAIAALLIGKLQGTQYIWVYVICFCVLWGCLGGWLAIAPAATASYFGIRNYGTNYGIVFTAYGVGALIGSYMAGSLKDLTGSYSAVFFPWVFSMAIAGIVIAVFFLNSPKKETQTRKI